MAWGHVVQATTSWEARLDTGARSSSNITITQKAMATTSETRLSPVAVNLDEEEANSEEIEDNVGYRSDDREER